ncbi:MAG: phosphotriesterase-related protein [Streptomyces sp.]|uniref:phosphotriesterase family protein n=1 Tax=Streptomyces sp. TaxID=1931 RepID=UPI0025D3DB21|nr:phosphotriesterase-related protein [Streptomyces sp.]MBW8801498.1 phosphotriesterase-related protein [Streptomyces sp.]
MTSVSTVLGSVDSSELGRTYMHEHVFVLTSDVQQNWPDEWDEEERVADAVAKLTALAGQGVRTIVDPTVVGLGRYLPRIRRVNEQVPQLQIVAATGVYTYDDVPFFFHHRGPAVFMDEPMVDLFVRDLTEGNHGVVAGMLKCAIDEPGLTPGVERIMRAVAQAHQRTGAPITVHTHPGTRTAEHVKRVMVDEEGVDPTVIVLGHSGDTPDVDYLESLAQQGFTLGMDRFGINVGTTFEARADTLVELCRRGLADRMVLSQDAACYIDWIDPAAKAFTPQWHYLHLADDVFPYVREKGVTEEQLTTMLVDVPRRVFER